MSSYNVFSQFYDDFTRNVDYHKRSEYLLKIFEKFDHKPKLLLDLCCGTGSFAERFSRKGIEVIGVDMSEDMLSIAQEKNQGLLRPVMYICQQAQELELYGTVDGAICTLDSLNHITNKNDLITVFNKVSLYLEPDRLFIFDMNTPYKHTTILANNSFVLKNKGVRCYWTNSLCDDNVTVRIHLDFVRRIGLFKKEVYSEEFCEKAYSDEEINQILRQTGFELLAVYEENTFSEPSSKSQRNIYVTRRLNNGQID